MSFNNSLKIALLLFIVFALGEVIFTVQHYGLPNIFKNTPKPGFCKILEEKYCMQGKIILKPNPYIAFNLTPGTKIFSPMTGEESKSKLPSDQGFSSYIFNPNDRTAESYTFSGAIDLPNMNTEPIQEGKTFAVIGNMKVRAIGNYNFFVIISKFDKTQNKAVFELAEIKKLFQIK